ncbi:MAG: hypothetical protein K9G26_01450 [Emcibacter sp.]|nr:hypothetical protein [Emcibacter sp.]
MKITTNAHLLSSLTSLIDPGQREQNQALQDKQNLEQQQKTSEGTEREELIKANRAALQNLQERLKSDKIEKLKAEFSVKNSDSNAQNSNINVNLRESLGSNKPVNTRLGQIIDIRV